MRRRKAILLDPKKKSFQRNLFEAEEPGSHHEKQLEEKTPLKGRAVTPGSQGKDGGGGAKEGPESNRAGKKCVIKF